MQGNLLWATASWTSDPWHFPFRSASNLTGVFYYPGANGVIPSSRLEVYADAVDDFDYLSILKQHSKKAANNPEKKELVAQAENILQNQFYLQNDIDVEKFWSLRQQVALLIEQLQ